MTGNSSVAEGTRLADQYRLTKQLSSANRPQGGLWLAVDGMAGDASVVLRQLLDPASKKRMGQLWPLMQSLLHPQIPRFGGLFEEDESLWLVREWQEGDTFRELQQQRAERQLAFGAGEVLLLLRQLLSPLNALHAKGLVHGDINPSNLLRRHQDGLPVLLDFGLLQLHGQDQLLGATPSYAPRAQGRGEAAASWMDLHGLAVTAMTLLTGCRPEELLSLDATSWCWPEQLDLDQAFRQVMERMLSEDPDQRFDDAAEVLQALQAVAMPETTGPTPRLDRTVSLAPKAVESVDGVSASAVLKERPVLKSRRRIRAEERELAAEGRLWPVVGALLVSALVGTAIGWFLLNRSSPQEPSPSIERDVAAGRFPDASLPPAEVDQRQQLMSRLRALQVDRSWFLQLVDSSLLARFPERDGRLPSDALEDAPFRQVWNELAEEWMARIEQQPPQLRRRLGQLKSTDWQEQKESLLNQGVSGLVVEQLVTAGAQNLLPGSVQGQKPPEPYLQLWYAAALGSLADVQIEQVEAKPLTPTVLYSRVPPEGARLISIQVPPGHRLVMGINGTPLMQMTVYSAKGDVVAERGPLRVVTLPADAGSPIQVLVMNEGVASGALTLSARADFSFSAPLPPVDLDPLPDSATGAPGRIHSPVMEPANNSAVPEEDQ